MKVRDLLELKTDIDVYDDVCEELAIAFCGPLKLTEEGEKEFAEVLDYEIEIENGSYGLDIVIVHVDDPVERVWKRKLRMAKLLFESAAGFCGDESYSKWFVSENKFEDQYPKYDFDGRVVTISLPDGKRYMSVMGGLFGDSFSAFFGFLCAEIEYYRLGYLKPSDKLRDLPWEDIEIVEKILVNHIKSNSFVTVEGAVYECVK